ncbi:TonB family protein [Phormidesmis sp. 146-33]
MKSFVPVRHFQMSCIVLTSAMTIAAQNATAQTPAPTPTISQITAIQAPNSAAVKTAFQQPPSQRSRLLPEGIIQFVGSGTITFTNPKSEGNRVTVEIANTTLKDQKPLQLQQPYPGIAQITIAPLNDKTLQLSIVGEKSLPTVAWSPFDSQITVTACPFGFLPIPAEFQGEGSARLLYDVNAAGCPQNIRVAQSSGQLAFDAWAVRELQRRQLQPNRPTQALRLRVTYKSAESESQKQPEPRGTGNGSPTRSP